MICRHCHPANNFQYPAKFCMFHQQNLQKFERKTEIFARNVFYYSLKIFQKVFGDKENHEKFIYIVDQEVASKTTKVPFG